MMRQAEARAHKSLITHVVKYTTTIPKQKLHDSKKKWDLVYGKLFDYLG